MNRWVGMLGATLVCMGAMADVVLEEWKMEDPVGTRMNALANTGRPGLCAFRIDPHMICTTNGCLRVTGVSKDRPKEGIVKTSAWPRGIGGYGFVSGTYEFSVTFLAARMTGNPLYELVGFGLAGKSPEKILFHFYLQHSQGNIGVILTDGKRYEPIISFPGENLNEPLRIRVVLDLDNRTMDVYTRMGDGPETMAKNRWPLKAKRLDGISFSALCNFDVFPPGDFVEIDEVSLKMLGVNEWNADVRKRASVFAAPAEDGDAPPASDVDGDGLSDREEARYGTDVSLADSDGDGLLDGQEIKDLKTNPLEADSDGDGLLDGEEVNSLHTDPLKADSDGDGLSDYSEIFSYGSNPREVDSDGDGLSDREEVESGKTSPTDSDSDDDGIPDGEEQASAPR